MTNDAIGQMHVQGSTCWVHVLDGLDGDWSHLLHNTTIPTGSCNTNGPIRKLTGALHGIKDLISTQHWQSCRV